MKLILVKHLAWLWNNAEKILIFVFFATFPFNIRKVFLTPYSYLRGEFNEYMTLSLNWSDILILSLIIIYIIKYLFSQYIQPREKLLYKYNINDVLSIIKPPFQNVSRLIRTFSFPTRSETSFLFLFLFLLWLAISLIWAPFQLVAFYRLFIILFIVIFVAIIGNLAKKGDIKAEIIYIGIFAGGIFQSLTGISQFFLNRSLGLKILGESILGPSLPGVAKIIVSSVKHIRAYGTFPHPNILAGFLVLQIVLLASLLAKRLMMNAIASKKVPHETILARIPNWLFFVALIINTGCFFLTFSRSAFLSLVLIGSALLLINLAYAGRKIWLIMAILIFALVFHGFFYASWHQGNFLLSNQSLEERNQYLNVSRETIANHPMLGVGLGQFVFQEIVSQPLWSGWQYQPVHNIYLLIGSELGMVGLVLFLLFVLTFLINYCKINYLFNILTINQYCIIILTFLFISFFDHYFWDIKQGMVIFTIPFLLHVISRQDAKKYAKEASVGFYK